MTAVEAMSRPLAEVDPEVFQAIQREVDRQHSQLELIASDKPFAFGRALFAKTKGQYLEVDLFVPEYILADKRMAAEPWFAGFKAGIKAGDALLIRRSERSYIIVFPVSSVASR